MSEAPQRMSIYPLEGTWDYGGFEFAQGDEPNKVEYVRADRIEELEAKLAKVKASYRRNMMQAYPAYTHEQFDKDYEEMMGGKDD